MPGEWYAKQLGPLPLGIWAGVIAVGAGASFLVNRKKAATDSATAPASDALTPATDGAFGSLPAGVNLGGVVALPTGVAPAGQNTYYGGSSGIEITDNNQWLRTAVDKLLAKGYDPGLVDSSLRAYLQGQVPTAAQQAVVNEALRLLGSPPFPVTTLPPTSGGGGSYGPVYPASGVGQAPSGTICPPSAPVLIQGANGYTCATSAQRDALTKWLSGLSGSSGPVYGPVYPSGGSGQAPPGTKCPPWAPVLIQGVNGYTCATEGERNALKYWLDGLR